MAETNENEILNVTTRDKKYLLKRTLNEIEELYGKGSIMKLGKEERIEKIDIISTGSIGLNLALGVGGIPKGRIIEVYGTESSGKTTIALHMAAEVQKQGGIVGFIDAEHALDIGYANNLGVKTEDFIISQPDTGEQALEIAEALIRSEAVDMIIIDSVAALVPKAELEGNMGDQNIALQARLMSQALRKLTAITRKNNCTVIFINQLRDKVGSLFGNSEVTTGGRALKFFSSIRLDVRRKEVIRKDGNAIGSRVNIKVVKNKVAPPFKSTELVLLYDKGIDVLGEIIELAINKGIVIKSGSWLVFERDILGQGIENAKRYLENDKKLRVRIENMMMEHNGIEMKQ